MVQINDDYYEDLTTENFEKLLDDLAAGRPVKAGSQIGRNALRAFRGRQDPPDPALYDGSVVGAWRKRFEEQAKRRYRRGCGRHRKRAAGGQGREADMRAAPSRATPPTRRPSAPRKASGRSTRTDQKEAADPSKATKVEPDGRGASRRRRAASPMWRHRKKEARRACQPDDAGSRNAAVAGRNAP